MDQNDPARPKFGDPISNWRTWFAWHPVQFWSGEWIWLKFCERRRIQLHPYLRPSAPFQWWQYQRIDPTLEHIESRRNRS